MPACAFQTFEGRIAQKGSCGYRMCLTVVVLQETNRKPVCCLHCAFVTSERSCVEMLGSYREISRSMEFATEIVNNITQAARTITGFHICCVCSEVNRCAVGSVACVCIAHRL